MANGRESEKYVAEIRRLLPSDLGMLPPPPQHSHVRNISGVMEDGTWADTGHGTPQGSVVSPVLANIYLHYVLDLWFHRKWRRTVPEGEVLIVRYADDFVLGFQYKRDAERFVRDLRERMASFGLEIHPGKTRLVEFGRFAAANHKQRRFAVTHPR